MDEKEIKMSKKFHRAFGVYGILFVQNKLTVVKKNGGPYINRFDLPGGSLEDGESLNLAVKREIKEETNTEVLKMKQLGTVSFKYPWHYERWNYNQHICVFYDITKSKGEIKNEVPDFIGQDSLGAQLVSLDRLTIENSSPLVLKAKDYLKHGKVFEANDQIFNTWKVLEHSVF